MSDGDYDIDCYQCGNTRGESEGTHKMIYAGTRYEPPEFEFFCEDCEREIANAQEAFEETMAEALREAGRL